MTNVLLVPTLRAGRLDLDCPTSGRIRAVGLQPEVVILRGDDPRLWRLHLVESAGGFDSTDAESPLTARITIEPLGNALVVRTTITNRSAEAVRIRQINPLALRASGDLRLGDNVSEWGILREGFQSWTGTRSFRNDEADLDPWGRLLQIGLIDVRRPSAGTPGRFRSETFLAIANRISGEALVAGFLSAQEAFGGIELSLGERACAVWAATVDWDDRELAPGAAVTTPPLWIAAADEVHALLDAYVRASGAAMQARVAERNPNGWCSWYYYFTDINEEKIIENVQALATMRDRFACDYVQVDDGYQSAIGDWLTPNAKFPRGMKWLAEQIRGAGFEAGIWTAPFIARKGSELLAQHPDWFVRNEQGGPSFALWNPMWGFGNCYALDTTHPAVLDWLRETFHTIVHDWGYRVLKLDFLFAASLPGQRHDPQASRATALRRGLDAIRAAAGEDTFLIGCGCPLAPAVGVVDAMRIGPDVAPFWSGFMSKVLQRNQHGLATKHAIRNILTRAHLHRRWWLNDPDCLMVRDTDTYLARNEIETLATAIAATDGLLVLSDRLETLSPRSQKILAMTLSLGGGEPMVVDLLERDIPALLITRGKDKTVVAAINANDTPLRLTLDLAKYGIDAGGSPYANDLWAGGSVPIADGVANFGEVPARTSRVLVFPK